MTKFLKHYTKQQILERDLRKCCTIFDDMFSLLQWSTLSSLTLKKRRKNQVLLNKLSLNNWSHFHHNWLNKACLRYSNQHPRLYLLHFKLKHIWKVWWSTREKQWWRRPTPLPRYPENEHQLKEKKSIKCCSGSKWDHKSENGQKKRVWEVVCYSLDCAMKRHVQRILAYLGVHRGQENLN